MKINGTVRGKLAERPEFVIPADPEEFSELAEVGTKDAEDSSDSRR